MWLTNGKKEKTFISSMSKEISGLLPLVTEFSLFCQLQLSDFLIGIKWTLWYPGAEVAFTSFS